jgi:surfeit locus 1 family protein
MPRLPILPTLLVAAAVATMIWLGVWQLHRADWKEALLARYAQAQGIAAPVPWPHGDKAMEESLFRTTGFTCERVLSVRSTAGTAASGAKGWAHVARCAIGGGGEAEVALGWSADPETPAWAGGVVHGVLSPGGKLVIDQPVAPLQKLAPPDPNDLPNNHMAYAVQWFLFALTAVVIYLLALRRRAKA